MRIERTDLPMFLSGTSKGQEESITASSGSIGPDVSLIFLTTLDHESGFERPIGFLGQHPPSPDDFLIGALLEKLDATVAELLPHCQVALPWLEQLMGSVPMVSGELGSTVATAQTQLVNLKTLLNN